MVASINALVDGHILRLRAHEDAMEGMEMEMEALREGLEAAEARVRTECHKKIEYRGDLANALRTAEVLLDALNNAGIEVPELAAYTQSYR